jgi:NAD(P)H-nitrite reductase large subunit
VRSNEIPLIDFLLLGGGLASATAAETLRTAGAEGSIAILCAETTPPYHRPPLSKSFLLNGPDQTNILVHDEAFYRDPRSTSIWERACAASMLKAIQLKPIAIISALASY